MDEVLGRLAKSGINILDLKKEQGGVEIKFEYRWRPRPGREVWSKSWVEFESESVSAALDRLLDLVRDIREGVECV